MWLDRLASTSHSAAREHAYLVYVMASGQNGTLYIGMTSNLVARAQQPREGLIPGFTEKYGVKHLVWYEQFANVKDAIACERRLKEWRRVWKLELIERFNPEWDDLWHVISA